MPTNHTHADRDRGSVLPLALIMMVVMSVVVMAIAQYSTVNLKYGGVAENRSDQLSAADAGMRYAIDQLKLRNAGCILDTQQAILPGVQADFNGATAAVTCERITSGFEGIQAYAAVMTGVGVPPGQALLSSQSGSNDKVLGGPVYMSRIDNAAFDLSPPVKIEDGPLLYYDGSGTVPCLSKKPSTISWVNSGLLVFEPELLFGPVCVTVPWTQLFDSPAVPNLSALPTRDGTKSLTMDPVNGSYFDVSSGGGCRVFLPGRYISPPDQSGRNAYFQTGDYLMWFQGADKTMLIRQGVATAGKINPVVTTTGINELDASMSNECKNQQANDPNASEYGATFYFGGASRINVGTNGSFEIHARQQGIDYVSVQTLCTPNGSWCNGPRDIDFSGPPAGTGPPDGVPDVHDYGGNGGIVGTGSTLTAPATTADNFLYTNSGNNKEFVAQALVYAPLTQVEFGNVSNTATQKMLGGLIVSRLVLQSSTSATNFEISVPTSPITALIQLTSTAVKDGTTTVQAVVQYRPYEEDINGRLRIKSWRVCENVSCN